MLLPSYATSIYVVGIFCLSLIPTKLMVLALVHHTGCWLLALCCLQMRSTCFLIFNHSPGSFCFNGRGQATKGFCWGWHLTSHPFRWSFGQFRKPSELYWCSAHIPGCQERRVCPMPWWRPTRLYPPHFPLLPILENPGKEESEVGLIWLVHNQVKFLTVC